MPEAVEICKLRLFLKLVAQIDDAQQIEPLPDIDFNIRAGNTLVGFATLDEVKRAIQYAEAGQGVQQMKLMMPDDMATQRRIEEQAELADRAFRQFREMQTKRGMSPRDFSEAKQTLRQRLDKLNVELNGYLAGEYGIDAKKKKDFAEWQASYQPFHWFVEFYGILKRGGFDVIIGNPPYVEYTKIKQVYTLHHYDTEGCKNLYAFVAERSMNLLSTDGSFGFIVPISLVCTQRMQTLQNVISNKSRMIWFSNFAERPGKLFVGAEVLLTIVLARAGHSQECGLLATGFNKWTSDERFVLFDRLYYSSITSKPKPYVIPKYGSNLEPAILEKMVAQRSTLGRSLRSETKYPVYYRIGGGRYWKIFTNFQPRFVLNGKQSVSSRENYMYLSTAMLRL
jgi:hypothetical protein